MLILRSLALGPIHAYGISPFLEQESNSEFVVDNGSLYPALQRLLQRGWVVGQWKTSPNARRALSPADAGKPQAIGGRRPRNRSASSRRWRECWCLKADGHAHLVVEAPRDLPVDAISTRISALSWSRASRWRSVTASIAGSARRRGSRRRRTQLRQHGQDSGINAPVVGVLTLENLLRDLRYALRVPRKSPAFTSTAITVAALALALNTAAFTLLDHARLRPSLFHSARAVGHALRNPVRSRNHTHAGDAADTSRYRRTMSQSFTSMGA